MSESQFNPTRSMPDSIFLDVAQKQFSERQAWSNALASKLEQPRSNFKMPSVAPKPKSLFKRLFG